MRKNRYTLSAVLSLIICAASLDIAAQVPERPRLILQITVDQLRADLPMRYYNQFGEGGFRYLMDSGTLFLDANHGHANTETIVGHATLATGADPAIHGMIGNVWLDRRLGELKYNVEDARYPILSVDAGVDKNTEIDPTQRLARSDGRSPSAILVSTFSDELMLGTAGRSKNFAVSVKDRGAISMAGHSGKAFWFSKKSRQFVTSEFYYDRYPEWVDEWNADKHADRYAGESWELLHDQSSYLFGAADDRPYETDLPGFGRVFPHPYGSAEGELYGTLLTLSPAGDELTLDFTRQLITHEKIGQDEVTDYLSVSFSSTDYVGHIFGPSSLESEDNLLRLDQTLASLFRYVDEQVGLDKTVIVLSADHGAPEAPGYLSELGFEVDYVYPQRFEKDEALQRLKAQFGIGEELITTFFPPFLYLDREAIKKAGLDLAEVQDAVAAEISRFDGVALAVSSSALSVGRIPDTSLHNAVRRNFNPDRSGDIYLVFSPNRFINQFDGLNVAVTHGSPWRYDSHVPIMFAGMGIASGKIARPVETVDIAPTLSILAGVKAPSGTVGRPLAEVLQP